MHSSESVEHRRIKELVYDKLREWTGAALQEYPSSGHELDVFAVTPDDISIYVEIIWYSSMQNFLRDLIMIQTVDSNVKLVVASPELMENGKCLREFEKVAISQRKLGIAMYGDLVDGMRILSDPSYLDTEFKDAIVDLLGHVRRFGKVIGRQAEFQLPEPRQADNLLEQLLSNLFPVTRFPSVIFSASTKIRRANEVFDRLGEKVADHLFLLKNTRLYAFDDLSSSSSIFSPIISRNDVRREPTSEWLSKGDTSNDLMYLFYLGLKKYCRKRGLYYDGDHDRFVCLLKEGRDNIFGWRAGSRHIKRTVAKRIFGENKKLLFCAHYSANMRFIVIEDAIFLEMEPTMTFTSDGHTPIPTGRLASLMSRYLSKQYNSAYLGHVRFWGKYLSKLDVKISIPTGEEVIEVSANPVGAPVQVGILNELGSETEFRQPNNKQKELGK